MSLLTLENKKRTKGAKGGFACPTSAIDFLDPSQKDTTVERYKVARASPNFRSSQDSPLVDPAARHHKVFLSAEGADGVASNQKTGHLGHHLGAALVALVDSWIFSQRSALVCPVIVPYGHLGGGILSSKRGFS